MFSAAYPIACSLACAAVYVSIYAGLARGAPPRTVDLSGQVVVVTGSSAGIGLETATSLLGLGATVVYRDASGTLTLGDDFYMELKPVAPRFDARAASNHFHALSLKSLAPVSRMAETTRST